MAHTQDYIPTRDADFDGWYENLKNYVVQKTGGQSPAWTHIPGAKVTELAGHFTAWHTAYEKTLGPHTSVDTEAKNDAKRGLSTLSAPLWRSSSNLPPLPMRTARL